MHRHTLMVRLFVCLILTGVGFCGEMDSTKSKNPQIAFYCSLIPGMGQLYNGKWIKSALILSCEMAAINNWIINRDIYKDYDNGTYPFSKHRYLEKRNKYAWWIGFIYVYGMIDAIVDAHLYKFDPIMETPVENENAGKLNHEE